MIIVEKRISEIKEYAGNPRGNNDAVAPVAESIKAFGFKQPIVVDKHNIIIAGHTRYQAAIKLGLETVPVVIADDLSEDEVKAYRLVDNKCGEYATWLDNLLKQEIASVTINLNHWDFPNLSAVGDIPSVAAPDIKSINYNEKFGVVVDCTDENEQRVVFELLQQNAYKPRIVSI